MVKNEVHEEGLNDMPDVYLIIGCSHSGKSSYVKNTFIRGRECVSSRDLMLLTEFDDCILIGRYDAGVGRRGGTDSVERKQVGLFGQQIVKLLSRGKDIVLEGVRCISRPMMKVLDENGIKPKILWLKISPETSMKRQIAFGNQNPSLKITSSDFKKCENFMRDFRGKVETMIVDTESCEDFSKLSRNDLSGAKVVEHIIPMNEERQ